MSSPSPTFGRIAANVADDTPATLFVRRQAASILTAVSGPLEAANFPLTTTWVQLNGAIYTFRTEWLKRTRAFIDGTMLRVLTPLERNLIGEGEADCILTEGILEARGSA